MASLISKASLLMVPSVYEDGTLYNVLPSGNKAPDETGSHNGYDQTRADFTFSRGSNLAATRVNSDGLIEKGRENLLLQSNTFDTTWANASSTETSGQADKDGGTNAWKIDISGAGGRIYQNKSQSGVVTFSVYAKKGTLDWIIVASNVVDASFNLATGEKGTLVAGIDSSIEDVGGGWYRCSFTGSGSFTQFRIYPAIADNTYTGTSGNIYIQNAQLEKSMVATDYIETGATTAQAGILEDMPRINYDANGENGALLLESQRTNLFETSEYFGTSDWSKSSLTIETNKDTSPEGIKNASKIYPSASSSISYLYSIKSGIAATYTISAYVKANGKNVVWLYINSGSANGTIYFDLSDQSKQVVAGSAQTPTGDIESLGNDWYRIIFTTGSGITLNSGSGIGIADAKGSTSVTKNGEDGVLVYGLQLEAGSHVSSYIPTHGAAVTRGADDCSVTGVSDVIGQSEGTIFVEVSALADDATNRRITLSDGTATNRMYVSYKNYTNQIRVEVISAGVSVFDSTYSSSDITENSKIALAYKANDFAFYVDGTQVATDTSGAVPSSMSVFKFEDGAGGNNFFGNVKQSTLFDTRLTNSELATLTTL